MRIIERIDGWITAETAICEDMVLIDSDPVLLAERMGAIRILKALKHELEQEAKSGRGDDLQQKLSDWWIAYTWEDEHQRGITDPNAAYKALIKIGGDE